MAVMAQNHISLSRVDDGKDGAQGASFLRVHVKFNETDTTIPIGWLMPETITPQIGDTVMYKNGRLGTITGISEDSYTIELIEEQGAAGKSPYEYAQDGGYSGTEEEFVEDLGSIGDVKEAVLKTIFDDTISESRTFVVGTDIEIGDVIDVFTNNTKSIQFTIIKIAPSGMIPPFIGYRTSGNADSYSNQIVVEEDFDYMEFDSGWTITVTRNMVEKNANDISKLSEEIESLKEILKQLIQNGDTDDAVAVLDQAILDLSTLA